MKHFRLLHYLLKDKNNYNRDEELSKSWEIYLYYLEQVRHMSWYLIKKKLLYFIKFKKIYISKLILIMSLFMGILFFGGQYILDHNSFFQIKRIVVNNPPDTLYCPDTIPIESYTHRLSNFSGISADKIKNKIFIVTIYTSDSTKTSDKWLKSLGQIESGCNIKAENGQYWGYWQMGPYARKSSGFEGVSKKDYLNSYDVQRASVIIYLKNNYKVLKPYIKKYNNKVIRGYHLTTSGLLAMSHNSNPQAVIRFLENGCIPSDSNLESTRYLTLGNYNIENLLSDDQNIIK